jgi:predicted extracellular nuclease
VIITETDADAFRTFWGLDSSVKVLGGYTNNLGRNDEINLFDNLGQLVDRLAYGDQNYAGTIRTQTSSGRPLNAGALASDEPYLWVLSTAGDIEGSWTVNGSTGSPGQTALAPEVPLPAAAWLFGSALLGMAGIGRHRA